MSNSKENKEDMKKKQPPSKPITSKQYDIFANFLTNDRTQVSNTMEVWDNIPKYFLSPQEQSRLRTSEGLAEPYSYTYTASGKTYTVVIQPALIKQTNGRFKAFFPSSGEEVIEEVLKKLFTDQTLGIHDSKNTESWLKFSYGMIKKELKHKGCTRNYAQIKHSLEVMSKCVLTVYEGSKEAYTGAILQDYCSVDRQSYLNDSNTLHIARLSLFVSHAVNSLGFRQYNYNRLMGCKEQLSRWLLRRLINRFTYASLLTEHHFLYTIVFGESGMLRSKREVDNRKKILNALEELKRTGAIQNYSVEEKKQGNKIIDVKYIVKPTHEFSSEQKVANARMKLEANGTVDN